MFKYKQIRFLDHTNEITLFQKHNDALLSFALDDALATTVGEQYAPPTIRLWKHDRTLVLGIPDSRLPYLHTAVTELRKRGIHVVIRNSGGLAVMLDRNVLNMSLIIPNERDLSIHAAYELMYQFVQELFRRETSAILAYEIKGSYCPGDYDLSIDGKKFAGISQRRVRNGVAVQIYLDIAGSSRARAEIVRSFYEMAIGDTEQSYPFPKVKPEVMASLNELLGTTFTVEQIAARIKSYIQSQVQEPIIDKLLAEEKAIFEERYVLMEKRNRRLAK